MRTGKSRRKEKQKMMTLQNTKAVTITLPNQATISVVIPDCFDDKLIELLLRSLLGTIYGIDSLDEKLKSSFMLRFVGEMVSLAENSVRTIQLTNELESNNLDDTAKIIEQFIASLGKATDNKASS